MLTAMACEGYKAFRSGARLELKPITVVFGKNNSGKTTLVRLPLYLTASLSSQSFYSLRAPTVSFGSKFADLGSIDQPHPRIVTELKWGAGKSLLASLQHVSSPEGPDAVELLALRIDSKLFERSLERPTGSNSVGELLKRLNGSERQRLSRHRRELQQILATTIHIPSARPQIREIYELREPTAYSAAEVPYLLAADSSILEETARWMEGAIGVPSINVDAAAFAFRLAARERHSPVNLANAGRGTQSVLPVAALLLGVATGSIKTQLLIIEEPEAHLHPSAHGDLGDLIIAASGRSQVIVETHSENLILRLRRRISEVRLSNESLALYYIGENQSITDIKLDDFGSTENWPQGVFESDIEEAEAIINAKLATMMPHSAGEA